MSFDADYPRILKHANSKVRFFQLNIEPEDLLNEAYVNLHGQEYSLDSFLKQINNIALIEKHNGANNIQIGHVPTTHSNFTGEQTCRICREVKHISQFYINHKPGKKSYPRTECKECFIKISLESRIKGWGGLLYDKKKYLKIKDSQKYKKDNQKRVKKHIDADREKWNDYIKSRYQKDKEDITDNYLKKILRKKHKLITQDMLNLERERIIKKRFAQSEKIVYIANDKKIISSSSVLS